MNQSDYVAQLKAAALSIGKKAVLEKLGAALPFFATGFFNVVAGFIVGEVLEYAIMETELGAFFYYVDMRTESQSKDFQNAAEIYQTILKKGNKEEIADAEKKLIDSFRAFIKLRN